MSETNQQPTETKPAGTTPPTVEQLQPLVSELTDDVELGKKIVAEAKASGWASAIAKYGAEIAKEAQEDYGAINKAIPALKAGWRTTECWLIVSYLLVNGGFAAFGKTLPVAPNIAIATLIGIYTTVRGIVKNNQPAAK